MMRALFLVVGALLIAVAGTVVAYALRKRRAWYEARDNDA